MTFSGVSSRHAQFLDNGNLMNSCAIKLSSQLHNCLSELVFKITEVTIWGRKDHLIFVKLIE